MDVVLIVDNYDSFVYNIAQIVGELGAVPVVVRNDELPLRGVERINPDRIILSPGPGTPEKREDVGISVDIVRIYGKKIPILGICLGHQVIGYAYGAKIRSARRIMHGKVSLVRLLKQPPILEGLPKTFKATRYHSLVVADPPEDLEVDAVSVEDGEIMAIHHVEHPVYGLQFHPESVGTTVGKGVLKNFLDRV